MPNQKKNSQPPIYVVSGGKGIAGHTMVHSLLIQYPDNKLPVRVRPNVQSEEKINDLVAKVKNTGGIIVHTMVNRDLRNMLIAACKNAGIKYIDMMGPLANYIEEELGLESVNVPGLYRKINAQYFERVAAIEFAMNQDDGINPDRLREADIILTGVSRSGKTPLSVYMSMFGWKVANVPLVNNIPPPSELFEVDPRRVFGLTISLSALISIRHKRLSQFGVHENTSYIDQVKVREELRFANLQFDKGKFTKIHVTNKPIETTANEIIGLVSDRFGYDERKGRKIGETNNLNIYPE